MDGKQHTLAFEGVVFKIQDKRNAHRVGFGVISDQKVTANVQFAVVFFVKARGLFNVLVHRVFWDGEAVILLDPAFFVQRRGLKVDPNGLKVGELFQRLDLFLKESAIGKRKDVEHDSLPLN